jgi:integrase/recombinase XerD
MVALANTQVQITNGPAVLRPEQVRALVAGPDGRKTKGKRDRALLAVLVGGGLRVGEAVRLTVSNVEWSNGGRLRLTFRTSKTKDHPYRTVTLPAWAAKPLSDWLLFSAPKLWLFTGQRGEHLSVAGAEKVVNRYLRAIGRADLHTHSLRHSFASIVVRETRSIFVAQKLLGHADPRTTAKYYSAFETTDADNAADALTEAVARRKTRSSSDGHIVSLTDVVRTRGH